MADDSTEKELDLDTQQEEEEAPKAKSKLKLIIIAVVVLILIGASVFGTLIYLGGDDVASDEELLGQEAAAEEIKNTGPAIYLPLRPAFIVSYFTQGRQRYLQASLTVLARDAGAIAAVTEHLPRIRSDLVSLLGAQSFESLQTVEGIESLRAQCTAEVKAILLEEYGEEGIEQVLFTSFVMQ